MNKVKAVLLSSFSTLIIASATFSYIYFTDKEIKGEEFDSDRSIDYSVIQTRDDNSDLIKEQNNNNISNSRSNVITNTVKTISPAIVGINVTEIRQYRDPWSADPFWRQFWK